MQFPGSKLQKRSRTANIARYATLATAAAVFSGSAYAQFNASIAGSVQDPTGAIIPGASITLTNLGTQQTQTFKTGNDGFFRFNELAPAHYKLTVAADGFKSATYADVNAGGETPTNLNVKLATGGNSETVTVSADDTPALQTGDANINRTITSEEIQRLPIFGADPYELLRTAPGITGDGARSGTGGAVFLPNSVGPGGSNSGIFQTENQIQISADGQRIADNNYTIDGVSVNSLGRGGAAVVTPNQESVGSITVISTSYDAADGRNTGAQIKTVTKSGTNDLHGSLFFLYNEPGLNAFNRYGGPNNALPIRVNIKQRNYAASLGGPIVKNKLFLFASFQGYSQGNNSVGTAYVDTAQYRAAVIAGRPGGLTAAQFSAPGATPRIRNIITSDCSGYANNQGRYVPKQVNDTGPVVTQTAASGPYCQVVNGGLDIGSVTPGGASQLGNYLSYFTSGTAAAPGPSTRVGGGFVGGGLDQVPDVQNVQLTVPSHSRGKQYNGRVDYSVTSKDLLAVSTYFTKLDNFSGSNGTSRPDGDLPFKPLNSAMTLIYIHTFSPTWLNEFRANGTRFVDNGTGDLGGNINLGLPYIYAEDLAFNNIDYGVVRGTTNAAGLAQNTIEFSDQLTHVFGAHTVKVGGGVRFEQDNNNLSGGVRPAYSFRGLWNLANDAAFFESIAVDPSTGGPGITGRQYRSETIYGYVQHDWKVTPTFQFNAGFRYEIYTPYRNKTAPSFEPVLGTGANALAGLSLQSRDQLYNTDYGHYAPKLAFDWIPAAFDGKSVIRGGFAVAYNHLDVSLFENALANGPHNFEFDLCCGTSTNDFSTPRDGGLIQYSHGTSNSATSYPVNVALKTGLNANNFPNNTPGQGAVQVGLYGVAPTIKNPISYLYSLETETQLPGKFILTTGYAGSVGHHYARLVNQNFLYPNSNNGLQTQAGSDFVATTDSNQAYNALNVRVKRTLVHGLQFDGTYTFSKAIDNVTNGDFSDGAANQTNPANNKSERGPSDFDVRNRFTGTVLYTTPKVNVGNKILREALSGYQATSIVTLHSGFNWTPVVNNNNGVAFIPNSGVVSPIRPIAYAPGASQAQIGRSCSNQAFKTGSNFANRGASGTAGGTNYYSIASPAANVPYIPVVGRNSLAGPCYRDIDFSVGKQVQFTGFEHTATLRFQANMYNAFNLLQLNPITNEGFGTNIQDQNFGRSGGADAGRVIEFSARLNF